MAEQVITPNGSAGNGEAAGTKTRRARQPKVGVKRIAFDVPDEAYATLEAEAKKDFRSAENLAMVATMKYVAGLRAPATKGA